jgi:Transposase DDE domain
LDRRRGHHRKTLSKRAKAKRRSDDRLVICPSEPEAVLGRDQCKVFRPLDNVQRARDLESPLILGFAVLPQANDAGCLGRLLERAQQLGGHELKEAVVDSSYAGQVDLKVAQQKGAVVYAPAPGAATAVAGGDQCPGTAAAPGGAAGVGAVDPRGAAPEAAGAAATGTKRGQPKVLPKEAFVGLEAEQTYRCPAGHRLVLEGTGREKRQGGEEVGYRRYRCPSQYCRECPLSGECTRAPERGRAIKRSDEEELVEALRRRMSTPEGQRRYRLRKQTVELGYADLKAHRGLTRFHSFGLERATAQVGLLVLMHNGKTVVKALKELSRADANPSENAA